MRVYAHAVPPERREDVGQLDGDSGEGEKPRHERLREAAAVAGQRRYLARHLVRARGSVQVARAVAPRDAAQHRQRERHDDVAARAARISGNA